MTADRAWFYTVDETLKREGIGRPCIVLDLDRVDHNLNTIDASLGERFRLVTKSLPSRELVHYVLARLNRCRLMAFHVPFLRWMVEELPEADILMGKPVLTPAIAEFFSNLDEARRQQAAVQIQWLVDTPERLDEHLALAKKLALTLRISLEIDVGLHRGGVSTPGELVALLEDIESAGGALRFAGLMGYEAHVPFMPDPDDAHRRAMTIYAEMAGTVRERFDEPPIFNSGGSNTYPRFTASEPVNDVSAGSAVVKPAAFDRLTDHLPALFIAAPVIRKFPRVSRKPVAPDKAMCIYLYGGGWAAEVSHPAGISIGPFADPPNQNLLPNQSLYETSREAALDIGDFVFFRPYQGDAMFQFEDIQVMRDGQIVDRWKPFPLRF